MKRFTKRVGKYISVFDQDSHRSKTTSVEKEAKYKATSKWTTTLQWSIVGCIGFGTVFSLVARIDEVVIARGQLQGAGAERPIKSATTAVVSEILVNEGELVRPGQVIVQLDPEINKGRLNSLEKQKVLEIKRLQEEEAAFSARKTSLTAELNSQIETLRIESRIVERMGAMVTIGAVAEIQYLQQRNRLQERKSEIAQTRAGIKEVDAESKKSIQQIKREILNIERQLSETAKAIELESLTSPIMGHVFNLVPSSPGYIVSNGETIAKIIPIGDLEAKVFISNADIGFVKPNMKAAVRVDAFPFTQFGEIPGKLKAIGKDALPPDLQNTESRFPAIVSLERQYLLKKDKEHKVSSGNSVTVNFVVRSKPLISLLTDSIEKAVDSLRGIKTDQP